MSQNNKKRSVTPFLIVAWLALTCIAGVLTFALIYWFSGENPAGQLSFFGGATATPTPQPTATSLPPTAVPTESPTEASVPTESPTEAPPPAPGSQSGMIYGVHMQATNLGDPNYWMDLVNGMGLKVVKHQIFWHEIEPAQGQMNWGGYDAVFEAAKNKDFKVVASVVGAPEWSRSIPGTNGPPDDYQLFANFVGELVKRYPGQIIAVEIWNEPNLVQRDWMTGDKLVTEEDPGQYVEFLRLAAQAIKAVDPNIMIISAALSPTGNNDPTLAMDDFKYLELMVSAGLLDTVDCIGVHSNGLNVPPEAAFDKIGELPEAATWQFTGPIGNPHHSWSMYSTITGYHERTNNKPLCITEFGWPSRDGLSDTLVIKSGFEFATDNTADEQADYILRALKMFREMGYVKMAVVYNLNLYTITDPENSDNVLWALLDSNGAPRASYWAVASAEKP
ncbi:MAG TPA: cellulase family glycosylhydrolase [Anaerolineales bacterium]|nr:cellulase family glycosylhydrolase [Anaerolineales bacterium]